MKDVRVNLGGDRLGSGNMMDVTLSARNTSHHNLSRIVRTSATNGTLIPFLTEVILPGDRMKCHLEAKIMTHPTTGPLFGYFKAEMALFKVNMRYYMAPLHNDYANVGTQMASVKIPQMRLEYQLDATTSLVATSDLSYEHLNQVAADSLLAYMGVRGIGRPMEDSGEAIVRDFNAIPMLAMADIYKMYYANMQEGVGAIMSGTATAQDDLIVTSVYQYTEYPNGTFKYAWGSEFFGTPMVAGTLRMYNNEVCYIRTNKDMKTALSGLFLKVATSPTGTPVTVNLFDPTTFSAGGVATVIFSSGNQAAAVIWGPNVTSTGAYVITTPVENAISWAPAVDAPGTPGVKLFDISQIDKMRMQLLRENIGATPVVSGYTGIGDAPPYSEMWGSRLRTDGTRQLSAATRMNGLFVRTHKSDRFQNWLNADLIEGPGGVTASSAIDVSDGLLTMDALNLAKKTYELLNRTVAAGNRYSSWLKARWNVTSLSGVEMPMYIGGAEGEIGFAEVVSTAETDATGSGTTPLGSLAGRGVSDGVKGKSTITIVEDEEPGFIIGLFSLIPRIDYSQGNKWWTRLKTLEELHNPIYDGIGFQDLITDEIAAVDTIIQGTTDRTPGAISYNSAGKQPAFIEYQTAVNENYGSFAYPGEEMFMTLARVYNLNLSDGITDMTSYINPAMYLQAFATSNRTDQHFWVQIGVNLQAERLMAATSIPTM